MAFHIEATTNGTDETLTHIRSRLTEILQKMDMVRVWTFRDEVNASSLVEGESIIQVTKPDEAAEFGGLLRDIIYHGTRVELVVDSYERFAVETEPSGGALSFENDSDQSIIQTITNDIPNVQTGTLAEIETSLSFIFAHTTPAKQLREVEAVTTGEIQYQPDGTADYTRRIGRDRTDTTLSPSNGKLDGTFRVNRIGSDKQYTHLRVLGAGEGEYQLTAEQISPGYSQGDRKKWGVVTNKSITDQTTLDTYADTLIDETDADFVEIAGTAVNQRVNVGDSFHITYPEKNIDRDLRAVEVETKIQSDGIEYECVFSNRQKTRIRADEKQLKDVERFNKSVQGTAVPINAGSARQTVDAGNRYRLKFYYPSNVVNELRLNIRVAGFRYRDTSGGTVSETDDFPENCNVLVNGESLDTSFGDGSSNFQGVVNAQGVFTQGEINTIDVTSDSLGDMLVFVEGDVYRQTFSTG